MRIFRVRKNEVDDTKFLLMTLDSTLLAIHEELSKLTDSHNETLPQALRIMGKIINSRLKELEVNHVGN